MHHLREEPGRPRPRDVRRVSIGGHRISPPRAAAGRSVGPATQRTHRFQRALDGVAKSRPEPIANLRPDPYRRVDECASAQRCRTRNGTGVTAVVLWATLALSAPVLGPPRSGAGRTPIADTRRYRVRRRCSTEIDPCESATPHDG